MLLYGQTEGTRSRGRPKKKWIGNIQEDCSDMGLTVIEGNQLAHDISGWKVAIQKLGCQHASTMSSLPRH